jgi:hypothetical protein
MLRLSADGSQIQTSSAFIRENRCNSCSVGKFVSSIFAGQAGGMQYVKAKGFLLLWGKDLLFHKGNGFDVFQHGGIAQGDILNAGAIFFQKPQR